MGGRLDDLYTTVVKHDNEGNRVPARLSGLQWLAPALLGGLKPRAVPKRYWKHTPEPFEVELTCLCDRVVLLTATRLTSCECGRRFVYTGAGVLSLLPPTGVH